MAPRAAATGGEPPDPSWSGGDPEPGRFQRWLDENSLGALKMASALIAVLFLSIGPELLRSAPRDLTPGAPAVAMPLYVPPPGCPAYAWRVGDYMPAACVAEWRNGRSSADYGLANEYGRRHQLQRQTWLRIERDAVGVACPSPTSDCLVRTVVHDRFTGRPATATPAPRPPLGLPSFSYGAALFWKAASPLLIVFGFLSLTALFRRTRRPDRETDWATRVRFPSAP